MKLAVIAGILLIAAGIYIAAGQASYQSNKEVLKIGGLEASVKETHVVPAWAGVIGIVAGGGLVFVGLRRPR